MGEDTELEFFDCNTFIGNPLNVPVRGPASCGVSTDGLLAAMDRAGIGRALVWHAAQADLDPLVGNDMLVRETEDRDRLVGCWTILPTQTGELGDPDAWLRAAAAAGVRAFRAMPSVNRYLLRSEVVGPLLERMIDVGLPLILPMSAGVSWPEIYDLLAAFPELTAIVSETGCWGADRYFRPLIERYANVCVEISDYMLDGGIEAFVRDYGAGRMLFGSAFPARYHGGMMLALAHAEISCEDKQAIAGGNLDRILAEGTP